MDHRNKPLNAISRNLKKKREKKKKEKTIQSKCLDLGSFDPLVKFFTSFAKGQASRTKVDGG